MLGCGTAEDGSTRFSSLCTCIDSLFLVHLHLAALELWTVRESLAWREERGAPDHKDANMVQLLAVDCTQDGGARCPRRFPIIS